MKANWSSIKYVPNRLSQVALYTVLLTKLDVHEMYLLLTSENNICYSCLVQWSSGIVCKGFKASLSTLTALSNEFILQNHLIFWLFKMQTH